MKKDYDFYMKLNVSPYIGEWIAICDAKLVSHDRNIKNVFDEVKKRYPNKRPFLTKVPEKETMIF